MRTQITEIKPTFPYWAIIEHSDHAGIHTGKAFKRIELVEFSDAFALEGFLNRGTIDAEESMGEYSFEIIKLYTTWNSFEAELVYQQELSDERNREYYESVDDPEELEIEDDCESDDPDKA